MSNNMSNEDFAKILAAIENTVESTVEKAVEQNMLKCGKTWIKEAVVEVFSGIGLDASNPSERQRDFIYLTDARRAAEDSAKTVRQTIVRGALQWGIPATVLGIIYWIQTHNPLK